MYEEDYFPEDWSKLSSTAVIRNIDYLLNHTKESVKCLQDDGSIVMTYDTIDNVRFGKNKKGCFFIGEAFNWPETYYYAHPDDAVYEPLKQLFYKYKQEIETRKDLWKQMEQKINAEKQRKRALWRDNHNVRIMSVVILAVLLFIGARQCQRQKEVNKAVKQYEKTLPYYNEYKQTQSQIANYRDSLWHAIK
jgi:hypothetical protein